MDTWLTSLITKTPQEGYELAITMSRKGVGYVQPGPEVKNKLRAVYVENADSLTFSSQVIAINFQTVALQITIGVIKILGLTCLSWSFIMHIQ